MIEQLERRDEQGRSGVQRSDKGRLRSGVWKTKQERWVGFGSWVLDPEAYR